jgi:hypothetical protein
MSLGHVHVHAFSSFSTFQLVVKQDNIANNNTKYEHTSYYNTHSTLVKNYKVTMAMNKHIHNSRGEIHSFTHNLGFYILFLSICIFRSTFQ